MVVLTAIEEVEVEVDELEVDDAVDALLHAANATPVKMIAAMKAVLWYFVNGPAFVRIPAPEGPAPEDPRSKAVAHRQNRCVSVRMTLDGCRKPTGMPTALSGLRSQCGAGPRPTVERAA